MENSTAPQITELNSIPVTPSQPKLLFYLLLVFLLLLVGLGGFILGKYFTETKEEPVDTAIPLVKKPKTLLSTGKPENWKTFTNNKYSLKYPPDWIEKEYPLRVTNFRSVGENVLSLTVSIYDQEVGGHGAPGPLIKEENIILDNHPATKKTFRGKETDEGNLETTLIFTTVKVKNQYYTFDYVFSGDDKDNEKLLDQILSTFKFID